ncbi:MAG: DUF5683 domain-containing protein [Candidatus Cryptobacteroides sp.]
MSRRIYQIIIAVLLGVLLHPVDASAQFREEAFTQTYNEKDDTTGRDTTDTAFSFKEYFGGISHKRDARLGVLFAGSTVFVGGQQMYNRQYWKLPVIYGGIVASTGLGIYCRHKYNVEGDNKFKTASTICFVGTGLFYWGSLLDGVVCFNRGEYPQAGKATLYAALLPGLGQAYNGEYWKIPVYYTALMCSAHFLLTNNTNYKRYRRIYNEATMENSTYDGPVSASTAKYYRDVYRRYRDYSVVALLGFYVLQIIDANVFAYMHNFELSDDLSVSISPAVIAPDNAYASALHYSGSSSRMRPFSGGTEAFGLSVGLRF